MRLTTTLRKVLLISLLVLLSPSETGTAFAGRDIWTSIGPEGGHVMALAIDPFTPTTLYAGTLGGGGWHRTDLEGMVSFASDGDRLVVIE